MHVPVTDNVQLSYNKSFKTSPSKRFLSFESTNEALTIHRVKSRIQDNEQYCLLSPCTSLLNVLC